MNKQSGHALMNLNLHLVLKFYDLLPTKLVRTLKVRRLRVPSSTTLTLRPSPPLVNSNNLNLKENEIEHLVDQQLFEFLFQGLVALHFVIRLKIDEN